MALDPELREAAVIAIREAALAAFEGHVHAIILKGSARTDDFNPGFSDLDIHVYVPSEFMMGPRTPRLEPALAFQRAIGQIDPASYGVDSFQVYFLDVDHYPEDWSKPVPGTYELVYGGPIDDAASDAEHRQRARETLASIPAWLHTLLGRFVDKPDRALPSLVRLACILLKGELYSAAILVNSTPQVLVNRSLSDLIAVVQGAGADLDVAKTFFARVAEWPTLRERPEALREAFGLAVRALERIRDWSQPLLEKDAE